MFRKILLAALVVSLLCPMSAMASMYVGAAIGNTWQSATTDADEVIGEITEIDENSTGWKIFGGFQSQNIFGLEGGYRDLGEIETNISGVNLKSKTTGWDVEAVAHLELSVIDLFAKAGAFFWESEEAQDSDTAKMDGTAFIWGLGAGISLGPIGVRLEYEAMDVDSLDNLSMLSLGATFGF